MNKVVMEAKVEKIKNVSLQKTLFIDNILNVLKQFGSIGWINLQSCLKNIFIFVLKMNTFVIKRMT